MRRCSSSIQGECGKFSGLAPRSFGGKSLMASSNVAWAWPPERRAMRCSRSDWLWSSGIGPSAALDALIWLEGADRDSKEFHHREHRGKKNPHFSQHQGEMGYALFEFYW